MLDQQEQSCRQQPGFSGARGCCYAVTLVEASPIGAESVHSSNQPVIMTGSSNGEGAGGPDDEILKDEYFFTNSFYEYERGQAEITVKDRLRKHIHFWRKIGTDPLTLEILENGYVIPFYSKPKRLFCKNNKSALKSNTFVVEAIKDLEIKGLIARCSEKPYIIVNPLMVSVQNSGEKRFILDLRLVNKHLWKRSVKFEDLKINLNFVNENCWMIKFYIHSAYRENQTDMLGFSWKIEGQDMFFKFLVMPFGLRYVPYCFTKTLKPLVKKWRSESKRVVMY